MRRVDFQTIYRFRLKIFRLIVLNNNISFKDSFFQQTNLCFSEISEVFYEFNICKHLKDVNTLLIS